MKIALQIYKLHFTDPLHIGDSHSDYGISQRTIQSDTFYAALTSCLAKLGKEIPKDGDLGFTISSLFPFYQKDGGSNPIYFFPKPIIQKLPEGNIENAKKIKKIVWLDKDYFNKVLRGEVLFKEEQDMDNIKGGYLTNGHDFDSSFISDQVNPRVVVSRSGKEDATPFYMDRVFFKESSGLFFMCKSKDEQAKTRIEQALNILQHEGIGTDRNVGNGFFTYTTDSIELDISNDTNHIISLSVFIPESQEQINELVAGEDVGYDILRRGGWITTSPHLNLRKKSIYAFAQGSVFNYKTTDTIVELGKIENLKPDDLLHNIYRCGKGLFLPIKIS